MNVEIFSEWLRRQNYRVLRTDSSYWFNPGFGVWQAFPYHWVFQPAESELFELLTSHHGIGLRFSTALEAPVGCLSYHAVSKTTPYDLTALRKKARYDVRQGLGNCHVQQISFQELAQQGWRLQADTLDRQGRGTSMTFTAWKRLCLAAQDLQGFAAWGAVINGKLGAAAITARIEDWCYILYQQSHREYLPAKINNALTFRLTKEMLARPEISHIHYGLHSLDAPASVDEFKFRMGYIPKPVRQQVVFHPWLQPLVNNLSYGVIKKIIAFKKGHPTLAKAEGMMRFYLEGLKAIEDQQWPACLENSREKILADTMNGPPRRTIS